MLVTPKLQEEEKARVSLVNGSKLCLLPPKDIVSIPIHVFAKKLLCHTWQEGELDLELGTSILQI